MTSKMPGRLALGILATASLIAMLVFVAAPGPFAGSAVVARTATRTAAPGKTLNIVFIGDSITEGNEGVAPAPARAVAYLLEQAGVARANHSNQGHSGYTTVDFLPARGETFAAVEKAADGFRNPNDGLLVFSIMLGTNDSAMDGPLGAPVSPADYRRNLTTIVDRLLEDYPGSRVILHRPTWYSPNTQNNSRYLVDGLSRLQAYFPQIDAVVAAHRHSHPQRVFAGDRQAFDFFKQNHKAYLLPEQGKQGTFYLHPNAAGATILGRFWGKAIHEAVAP